MLEASLPVPNAPPGPDDVLLTNVQFIISAVTPPPTCTAPPLPVDELFTKRLFSIVTVPMWQCRAAPFFPSAVRLFLHMQFLTFAPLASIAPPPLPLPLSAEPLMPFCTMMPSSTVRTVLSSPKLRNGDTVPPPSITVGLAFQSRSDNSLSVPSNPPYIATSSILTEASTSYVPCFIHICADGN